ncbi:molybdenum cofactor biosynthesis protein MoaE [Alteromonas sp. C1M14]|uniref:molybdenum cofactor biosynthesis protein MoaE n=1 Tax=Alteromonas sp. C1M14 TaxID=2841567 RepID=UPI001C097556|nr:molybdenum cofactor biosynthesis protein MoaE [Alteromonas sp. C1M14]MBU2977139.1 molybdenum cofactor biosynthesis protein MoaE [Alteromonas sp. C1M14]
MGACITSTPLTITAYHEALQRAVPKAGAIVTFTGQVRDYNQQGPISGIHLEHYPGMTENALTKLVTQAIARFSLLDAHVVHRIGDINNYAPIVWVGTAASHRKAAFDGACYVMDLLKQSVPLWKKEYQGEQGVWVQTKASDDHAAMAWLKESPKGEEK